MPHLLAIESSPRGEYSVSRKLSARFIEEWKTSHPGGEVVMRDLVKTRMSFADLPWITGSYSPPEQHSAEMQEALRFSNELIAELLAVDHIVIGTSVYNFSIPALLKAYIDHIVRIGVTFSPSYEGLVQGKKVTVILAMGGLYAPGARGEGYSVAGSYLKHILGFIGMTDVTVLLADGTTAVDGGKTTLPTFVERFAPQIADAAKR